MEDTLKNKVACAIEPETFKQPHINLFLESYQKAWAKADAAIPVVLEEAHIAIHRERASISAASNLDYLQGLHEGYDRAARIVRNIQSSSEAKSNSIPNNSSQPKEYWEEIAKIYAKSVEHYQKLLERSEKALKPFAGCIFNDNGDITVDYGSISDQYNAYVKAYFLHRELEKTLKEIDNG